MNLLKFISSYELVYVIVACWLALGKFFELNSYTGADLLKCVERGSVLLSQAVLYMTICILFPSSGLGLRDPSCSNFVSSIGYNTITLTQHLRQVFRPFKPSILLN